MSEIRIPSPFSPPTPRVPWHSWRMCAALCVGLSPLFVRGRGVQKLTKQSGKNHHYIREEGGKGGGREGGAGQEGKAKRHLNKSAQKKKEGYLVFFWGATKLVEMRTNKVFYHVSVRFLCWCS